MATGDISIQVKQGNTVLCSFNANGSSINISGPCPAANPVITIAAGSTCDMDGTSATDSVNDAWRMASNVKITANQAFNSVHIIFQREHSFGPNSTTAEVYYKVRAKGTITGGHITLIGTVTKLPSPSATLTAGTVTSTSSPFDITVAAQGWNLNIPGNKLTGNRILKLDLELVNMNAGDILDLVSTGGWMKLRSQGTPDPDVVEDIPTGHKAKK